MVTATGLVQPLFGMPYNFANTTLHLTSHCSKQNNGIRCGWPSTKLTGSVAEGASRLITPLTHFLCDRNSTPSSTQQKRSWYSLSSLPWVWLTPIGSGVLKRAGSKRAGPTFNPVAYPNAITVWILMCIPVVWPKEKTSTLVFGISLPVSECELSGWKHNWVLHKEFSIDNRLFKEWHTEPPLASLHYICFR